MSRLICNPIGEGHRVPSYQRTCGTCGTGVWVSMEMAPVVDSGEAAPLCVPCWDPSGSEHRDGVFAIHPRQMHSLAENGVLDFAYRFVNTMNTLRDA